MTRDILWIDTETYSEVNLKQHGTDRYARNCEIMIFGYAFNDDKAVDVDLTAGEKIPQRVLDALADDSVLLYAQNSFFDRTVMNRNGLPTERERWRDTMVQAYAHSLPGALGKLGPIVGLPLNEQKDKDGRTLVLMFCKPAGKTMRIKRRTRLTHPDEWKRFRGYCRQDIEAMRAVCEKLPKWNYSGAELKLWHLDQKINDRGFAVDADLAVAAVRAGERALKKLAKRVDDITVGDVASATKRDALLKHIVEYYGVELPDMKADTLRRRLEDQELPAAVRQLIAIRLEASMTTKAKYAVLLRTVSPDGRLRNALQFCGAVRTGRWSGKMFQPHNMKRPDMKLNQIELGIAAMKADIEDMVFPNVMSLTANTARSCIVAPPGRKLVVSDLANIEGRGLAYLAGEEWKLQAFRDYDSGIGADLYKMAYARAFGIDPADVGEGDRRQIGKVMELALGYAGGVAAFIAFAMVYNIDLEDLAAAMLSTIPGDVRFEAEGMWKWACKKQRTLGLSHDVYIACEALKRMWRAAHRETAIFWDQLNRSAGLATRNPGVAYKAGEHITFQRDGVWLRMRLPSGRCLCYVKPEVTDKGAISYMGVNQYARQWARIHTHGGKLAENATQAFARDILAAGMPEIEDAGYDIVLTVHDENLTETDDDDRFTADELSAMMTRERSWAKGLPLAAKGYEGYRYRKE